MSDFAQQFLAALPALLLISGIVTWLIEAVKPTVSGLGLSDPAYALALRVIAAVFGVIVAGLLGNPNIFDGVIFYGSPIPPLVGMLATAVLASAGSNALHEIGEYLNAGGAVVLAETAEFEVGNDKNADSYTTSANAQNQSRDKPTSYTR